MVRCTNATSHAKESSDLEVDNFQALKDITAVYSQEVEEGCGEIATNKDRICDQM